MGSGRYGLAAVQGGAGDLAVLDQEADPGRAVGDQAVQRRGARAQRRRPGKHLLLEGPLVVVKQRLEDARPGAEPAEHRPLAQARPFGQPVHGQLVRALLGEHLARRRQQMQPVARGVGTLGGRRSPGHHGLVHGFTLRPTSPGQIHRRQAAIRAMTSSGVMLPGARRCRAAWFASLWGNGI